MMVNSSGLLRDKNFTDVNDNLFDCELEVTGQHLIKMTPGQKSE